MHVVYAWRTYEFMNIRQFQVRKRVHHTYKIYTSRRTIATNRKIFLSKEILKEMPH